MALSHSPQISLNGLVLCLDAGNSKSYPGSGTTWRDLSGNGNTGTLTNGPTYSSSNGGSIVFDGTNDYVLSPINLNFTQGTISTWIYPTEANNNGFFVYTDNDPFYTWTHQLAITDTNKLSVYLYPSSGNGAFETGTTTLNLNTWYYVTLLWLNDSYCRSYINGVLETTSSIGTAWDFGSNFWIGSASGSYNYFKGSMSGLTIHNRALTAAEIQQNYNALKGRYIA